MQVTRQLLTGLCWVFVVFSVLLLGLYVGSAGLIDDTNIFVALGLLAFFSGMVWIPAAVLTAIASLALEFKFASSRKAILGTPAFLVLALLFGSLLLSFLIN